MESSFIWTTSNILCHEFFGLSGFVTHEFLAFMLETGSNENRNDICPQEIVFFEK
jgi:hypothetical protein